MIAKMIHTMLRVEDEEISTEFYKRAFELDIADRYEFDTFTLVYMRNRETKFELELTVNKDGTGPYDLGNGYGHLAVTVEDIETAHAFHKSLEMQPGKVIKLNRDNTVFAHFYFLQDPDGYRIEVLQRQHRFL
jgi:lactoylglutathione lyase